MSQAKIREYYEFMFHAIEMITMGKEEAHFSIKMTGFIPNDVLERLSRAQDIFLYRILGLNSFH